MSARRRWYHVRVETDSGVYGGRLRLAGLGAVSALASSHRVYLTLSEATLDGEPVAGGFVAIHKAAIHVVTVVREGTLPVPEVRS